MKFSATLQSHLTPEWRSKYLDYTHYRKLIEDFNKKSTKTDPNDKIKLLKMFEESFMTEIKQSLKEVNSFFLYEVAKNQRIFNDIRKKVVDFKTEKIRGKRLEHKLKRWISEFYLQLTLLQNYKDLNCTGFRKILKKFDKNTSEPIGTRFYKTTVLTSNFVQHRNTENLMLKVEQIMIDLESGDHKKAMSRLRVPPTDTEHDYPVNMVRLAGATFGLFLGILIFLFYTIFSENYAVIEVPLNGTVSATEFTFWTHWYLMEPAFHLAAYTFYLSVNVWFFRHFGVNYILIFEIDPRHNLTHQHMFSLAFFIASFWAGGLLAPCLHKLVEKLLSLS